MRHFFVHLRFVISYQFSNWPDLSFIVGGTKHYHCDALSFRVCHHPMHRTPYHSITHYLCKNEKILSHSLQLSYYILYRTHISMETNFVASFPKKINKNGNKLIHLASLLRWKKRCNKLAYAWLCFVDLLRRLQKNRRKTFVLYYSFG